MRLQHIACISAASESFFSVGDECAALNALKRDQLQASPWLKKICRLRFHTYDLIITIYPGKEKSIITRRAITTHSSLFWVGQGMVCLWFLSQAHAAGQQGSDPATTERIQHLCIDFYME